MKTTKTIVSKNRNNNKVAAKVTAKKNSAKKVAKFDRFGSHVGTQSAAINSALTAKPRTPNQIIKLVKLPSARVRNHLRWLRLRKFVKATKAGYCLAK